MDTNFAPALAAVLVSEGGFSNNPADPGGATMHGVTQRVYNNYRQAKGLDVSTVADISADDVAAIYRKEYWDKVWGDQLPAGIDYCVFDFAVNSGVSRAIRMLQIVLGVTADGQMGPQTLTAARNADPVQVVNTLCGKRLAFLESLPTFGTFGHGWTSRVMSVQSNAEAMC